MAAPNILSAVLLSGAHPRLYQLRFPQGSALPCLNDVYAFCGQYFRVIGLLELDRSIGPLALGELIELPSELDFGAS